MSLATVFLRLTKCNGSTVSSKSLHAQFDMVNKSMLLACGDDACLFIWRKWTPFKQTMSSMNSLWGHGVKVEGWAFRKVLDSARKALETRKDWGVFKSGQQKR